MKTTLLLVEDDFAVRSFLTDNLTADGFEVIAAATARDALRALERRHPEIVVLDIGLPDFSGLELLGRLRRADAHQSRLDPRTPVILLSGRASEQDRVRGLERGADDYLSKPFGYLELRLRIEAVLRRMDAAPRAGRLRVGDLEIDPLSREVRVRGRRVELAQKEFALLHALAVQPTRVWTKQELLRDVWGFRSAGRTRTLDSHACRLRRKLEGAGDRFVVNVWGVGYRLVDGPVDEELAA